MGAAPSPDVRAAVAAGALGGGPLLIAYAALEDARAYHRAEPRGAAYFVPLAVVTLGALVAAVLFSWSTRPRRARDVLTRLATTVGTGAPIAAAVCAVADMLHPNGTGRAFVLDELAGFAIGVAGAALTASGIAFARPRPPARVADDIDPPEPGFFEHLARREADALARARGEAPIVDGADDPPRYEMIGDGPTPTDAELAEAGRRFTRSPGLPTRLVLGVAVAAIAHALVLGRGARMPAEPDEASDARNFIAAVVARIDAEADAELRAEAEAAGKNTEISWFGSLLPCPRRGVTVGHCWGGSSWDNIPWIEHAAAQYDAGGWSCDARSDGGPTPACLYALSMERFAGIGGPHDAKLAAELGARGSAPSIGSHAPTIEVSGNTASLGSEEVARRLRTIAPALRLCAARFASSYPTHVHVRFVVDHEGRVTNLGNGGSDGTFDMPRCVIPAFRSIDFSDLRPPHIAVLTATLRFQARTDDDRRP